MLGSIVIQEFGTANNWPQGAAIGVTIMPPRCLPRPVSFFARTEARD